MDNWTQTGERREDTSTDMKLTDRFLAAMFSPKEYRKLLKQPSKKLVSYLLCLVLLLTVIQNIIPIAGAIAGMGGFQSIIKERIPDFELKDGTFRLDDRVKVDDQQSGVYILIDTDVDRFTEKDIPGDSDLLETILVSKSNILVSNTITGMGTMSQEYKFSDFGSLHVTNETLLSMIPFYYVILFVICIVLFLAMGIRYLLSAVFYAAFLYFMLKITMDDRPYGEVYQVALYAKTIGALVEAVTYCMGNSLLMLAGSTFHFFITLWIMNRVLVKRPQV